MGLMQTLQHFIDLATFYMSQVRSQWAAWDFENGEGVTKKASGENGVEPAEVQTPKRLPKTASSVT